jgi:hypothetical protein
VVWCLWSEVNDHIYKWYDIDGQRWTIISTSGMIFMVRGERSYLQVIWSFTSDYKYHTTCRYDRSLLTINIIPLVDMFVHFWPKWYDIYSQKWTIISTSGMIFMVRGERSYLQVVWYLWSEVNDHIYKWYDIDCQKWTIISTSGMIIWSFTSDHKYHTTCRYDRSPLIINIIPLVDMIVHFWP